MSADADDAPEDNPDPFRELYETRRGELEKKATSDDANAYVAEWILDAYGGGANGR